MTTLNRFIAKALLSQQMMGELFASESLNLVEKVILQNWTVLLEQLGICYDNADRMILINYLLYSAQIDHCS